MTTDATAGDGPATAGPDARSYGAYDHVRVGDDLLVYCVDDEHAWLQSTLSVSLAERR